MFKVNNVLIIGVVVVSIYLINRSLNYKRVPTLEELNQNGGGSIFERFPVR